MINHEAANLQAARFERIREIVRKREIIKVDELCEELQISPATARRDLAELDNRGHLRRIHGGAISLEGQIEEPVFDDKTSIARKEKQQIVETAKQFIKPNDTIFLDGGSTVLALASMLADMKKLTVVTNSLRVVNALSSGGPKTILVGGELRHLSQTFVGPLTQPIINQLYVDTAFIGTIGLSSERGMTTTDPREAFTKELIMSHARQVVLLADSTKIGKVSFVNFGKLEDVDVLITDQGIETKEEKDFEKKGLNVVKPE